MGALPSSRLYISTPFWSTAGLPSSATPTQQPAMVHLHMYVCTSMYVCMYTGYTTLCVGSNQIYYNQFSDQINWSGHQTPSCDSTHHSPSIDHSELGLQCMYVQIEPPDPTHTYVRTCLTHTRDGHWYFTLYSLLTQSTSSASRGLAHLASKLLVNT